MRNQRRRWQQPKPKREGHSWKLRYYVDQDGNRLRKTKCLGPVDSMTYAEAARKASDFLRAINDEKPHAQHTRKTMADVFQKWRQDVQPMKKYGTAQAYEWAIMRLTKAKFDRIPISVLNAGDIQTLLTSEARKLSPGSVRTLKNMLSGLLARAKRWGWIERNPVRGEDFDLPEYRRARERPTLTPAQVWLLAENLPLFERTVVLLAVLTGLRKGELEALRWEDCGGASLTVDESSRRGRIGTPKSQRSCRKVTLGPRAQSLIAEWRAHVQPSDSRAFVFATRNSKPKDLSHVIDDRIKPVCKRLGIPEFSWHALRRSYTSWGRQAGIAAETMRDQLGHSSVLITQDIYSRIDRPDVGEQIESIFAQGEPPNRNPLPVTQTIQ